MNVNFISSKAIADASRLSIAKLQQKIAEAQKEMTTGRSADVGAKLGYQTGDAVSLRQEYSRLETIITTNSLVNTRMDSTQAALTAISETGQSFISTLMAARSGDSGREIAQSQAEGNLIAITNTLNTSVNGAYIFAGINADVRPIQDYYETPTPANRQAVRDAFQTAFGFPPGDAQAVDISADDMTAFLEGPFADLFDEPAWSANWSSASDQNIRSRISTTELVETSANANDPGIRKMASAFTMIADLGVEALNEGAFQAIVDRAIAVVGQSTLGLANTQAALGNSQERVAGANNRMQIQMNIMTAGITQLEAVDPYEASTRVSTLLTQIETSYALTARIQQLSILNYL